MIPAVIVPIMAVSDGREIHICHPILSSSSTVRDTLQATYYNENPSYTCVQVQEKSIQISLFAPFIKHYKYMRPSCDVSVWLHKRRVVRLDVNVHLFWKSKSRLCQGLMVKLKPLSFKCCTKLYCGNC